MEAGYPPHLVQQTVQVNISEKTFRKCSWMIARTESLRMKVLKADTTWYPLLYILKGGVSISDVNVQINEQIRDKEVRVIGEDGEQLGIMSSEAALKLADEAGLDLVKIAPNAAPPVVKIIDFSKYRYEQRRKEKEQKKKQNVIEVKEVRLTPNIDTNDLNTKVSAAKKFLEKGNKVKVSLRFRGRELSRMNQSRYILDDFAATLAEVAQVDKPSKAEGRSLVMILSPKKNK